MKMGSVDQAGTMEPKGEIYTCPACGYTDGFHVAFDFFGRGIRKRSPRRDLPDLPQLS